MAGFNDAWTAVAGCREGEPVSPELRPLLKEVYDHVQSEPLDLGALKKSLEALLVYLDGPGRTNANCWAVFLFFYRELDRPEQTLPDDFEEVLAMMTLALDDTVMNPEMARIFECLPEQLLERVRRLRP